MGRAAPGCGSRGGAAPPHPQSEDAGLWLQHPLSLAQGDARGGSVVPTCGAHCCNELPSLSPLLLLCELGGSRLGKRLRPRLQGGDTCPHGRLL